MEQGFQAPPESTKPWVYWYWVSGHISKEGITRDLEAMARVGIGEAFIGNVDVNEDHRGPIQILSEEWWDMIEHAIREGGRLGVRVGMFNCPGWSQSGGPWVKPDQTMRYLAISETRISGPIKFEGVLPAPNEEFQDIAVLAFPAPASDTDSVSMRGPRITASPETPDVANLFDGDMGTVCTIPENTTSDAPFVIDLEMEEPFTARSLVFHPATTPFIVQCELQAADENGAFKTVRTLTIDRSNPNIHVGFMPFGPVAVAFPSATSQHFRLVLTELQPRGVLAEIELTGGARLERFVEKQLGKMFQLPMPQWDSYLWPTQAEPDGANLAVESEQVIDLSANLTAEGAFSWEVPEGEWIVLRTGMSPTGVQNAPAAPEATGYEIDKMNRQLIAIHFDAFIGQVLRRMPPADRTAFLRVVADSYEMGSLNWTDGFAERFQQRYGYDPLHWLPVLTGRIVESAEQSDRFLWDMRRLIADRVAYDYVGGLREECEKHGLRLWLENYGHWGFPAEFLQYGGQSHDLGGEFWADHDLGKIERRAAASAAHIYGKPVVSAEAFTSSSGLWTMNPWTIKKRGDSTSTEGINHFVLHVYVHQPHEDRIPGINTWFGLEFNRHNTWFDQTEEWIKYLRRKHFLLQQGHFAADIAYFIGEDTPKMTGILEPELPPGYSFDWINAEVIEQRLQVKDGKFVLPDGMSYRLLILPEGASMRPSLLRKIRDLVKAGGAILGTPPTQSPSLENYPACDDEVRRLADEIWAGCNDNHATMTRLGKGLVFRKTCVQKALDELKVPPDVTGLDTKMSPWIHRTTSEGEIYFIAYQGDEPTSIAPSFRVTGRQPELWDAVTGRFRDLPAFTQDNNHTSVPLEIAPRQSLFIVFRKPAESAPRAATNFPPLTTVEELSGDWRVRFDPQWGGPQSVVFDGLLDWSQHPDDGIKYYSGTATYKKVFDLPDAAVQKRVYLDLGEVKDMGRVRLNGTDLGLIWCAPWHVDITDVAQAKDNVLEIDVVNTWANRIIGDCKLPADQRLTWTIHPHFGPDSPLLPAGLLGPVTLRVE
ncbi:MAG: glycoside hydrolase family 2 [Phycisphaerales bacterium]|nr:glycoside hydrolase family 2 [Phycisphaerales bacterium]